MRILPSSIFQINAFRKIALAALAVAALTAHSPLLAQSKLVDKANELYKNNQFSDAANLYSQALQEMENEGKHTHATILLKSKLAYCYRMNNKMDKAEALYAEVVKDESAKAENRYYYGEALMSNGKYEEAKKWFADFQKMEPTDEKVGLMIRACDYAPFIVPYFQYIDIQEFAYNSDADDNAPIASRNGLIFSSDRPQGVKLLKEKSGWTGRDYLNLYISEKKPDGGFTEPKQYSSKLSEVNKHTGNASLTADGSEIFFTRNDNVLNKQNTYSLQIFSAKSGDTERWKDVQKLPFCSSNQIFMHPAVSPDGKLLFFASNRAGGFGGTDIWVSERKSGEWGKPENLGPAVNTMANEGFPFAGPDGKLYFCSKGHPGYGGFDIFVTYKDENGAWQPATNLGRPINSPLDDISIYVSADQRSGYFTSSRSGGDDDIYVFKVQDKAPPVLVEEAPVAKASPTLPEIKEQPMPALNEEMVQTLPTAPVQEQPTLPSVVAEKKASITTDEAAVAEIEVPKPASPVVTEASKTVIQFSQHIEVPILPKAEATEKPTLVLAETARVEIKQVPPPIQPTVVETIHEIKPVVQQSVPEPIASTDLTQLGSFVDFSKKLNNGSLAVGGRFRLDGAVFDPMVWQLTPRIIGPVDRLIAEMKNAPTLQIEVSAHTEALGLDEDNLRISENRANTIMDYMMREGIAKDRIIAKGYGETMPINHCRNGTICSMDEHMFNQRLEVKVMALDGKW